MRQRMSLRIAFLVDDLGASGGMATVRRYARHLRDQEGMDVRFVVTAPRPGSLPPDDHGIPVSSVAEAAALTVDVAIATWWTTTDALYELTAASRVVFLQSLESRFYRVDEGADRLGALAVLDLPVDYIAVGSHMRRVLEHLRPDARCHVVPGGIDKAVFRPREDAERPAGPLRVLVEGQSTLWFKGVTEACAAVRAMREPATLTVVMADPSDAGGIDADRVVGALSPSQMADLYREHDVLLKLSRLEGLSLPPLEAMHVGLPCVLTPFTGSDDYARHGENALVVGFDDHPGTVAALDLLARDAALRRRLAAGGLETAAAWPDAQASSRAFADAVRRLQDDPPAPDSGLRRLARGRRMAVEVSRRYAARVKSAEAREGELNALAEERLALIYDLTGRPSYRAAYHTKRLLRRPNPR
jgi:glycosyltransferase involved in cell wall biosynthesis